jgi:hypothetical protein
MMIIEDMTLPAVMEPALNDVFPENSSTLACTTALPKVLNSHFWQFY